MVHQSALLALSPTNLAAADMDDQHSVGGRRQVVDFGCDIPFTTIPRTVQDGFEKLFKRPQSMMRDKLVLNHYRVAHEHLATCLGMFWVDLMLMQAMTLAAVHANGRVFMCAEPRDPDIVAARLVTRMLWFLEPGVFPWGDEDTEGVLRVSAMSQELERKGVNNGMLRGLGWVCASCEPLRPQQGQYKLRSDRELREVYDKLMNSMNRPRDFIRTIFDSCDGRWVELCRSIIKEIGKETGKETGQR